MEADVKTETHVILVQVPQDVLERLIAIAKRAGVTPAIDLVGPSDQTYIVAAEQCISRSAAQSDGA